MLIKSRRTLQTVFLILALLLIVHGLIGPQFAPKNLTTIFIWVHYRGVLILTLLLMGNFFCMGCPMMLVRDLARKMISPRYKWPVKLQNKYLGITFFITVLFVYEWLDLWADPRATAWLIVGLFVLALGVDLIFKKASFCKYVCPIGQFNFLSSTLSPTTITKRSDSVCQTCETQDCLHGNKNRKGTGALGCELALFIPNKTGNMDCTYCMECVAACPHDNVILSGHTPSLELWEDEWRSGIGKLQKRQDFDILVVVFTFGALLNAFGMVAPAYEMQKWLAEITGVQSEGFTLIILFVLFLLVLPYALIHLTNSLTRIFSSREERVNLISSLIPLGFSIWLGHYLFHFLTGALTFLPILGVEIETRWMGVPETLVTPIQIGIIIIGGVFSLWLTNFLYRRESKDERLSAVIPWWGLHLVLAGFAIWIMGLPMEMRGTFLGG